MYSLRKQNAENAEGRRTQREAFTAEAKRRRVSFNPKVGIRGLNHGGHRDHGDKDTV